jgi:hypothetical protein
MAWTSRLPVAIDGLVAAFTDWPGLVGVTVRDGPSTSQATVMEMLSVGYTGGEDGTDAESTLLMEGLGPPDREQLTIRCAAAVLRGGDDLPGARRRAFELLAAAGAAIAADRTLGGTVMSAMVASHSLTQAQGTQGSQAVVVFEVSCDAYTGR